MTVSTIARQPFVLGRGLLHSLRGRMLGAWWRRHPESEGAWKFVSSELHDHPSDPQCCAELAESAFRPDADAPAVLIGLARNINQPSQFRCLATLFERLNPTQRVAVRGQIRNVLLSRDNLPEEALIACAKILGPDITFRDEDDRIWVKAGYPLFRLDTALAMRNSGDPTHQARSIAIWIATDRFCDETAGRTELVRRFLKHHTEVSTRAIGSLLQIRRGMGYELLPPRPLVRVLIWRAFVGRDQGAASLLYHVPDHWLTNSVVGWGQEEALALRVAQRDVQNIPPFVATRMECLLEPV